MTTNGQRAERRTDALSHDRIVEAAIDILDTEGEGAQLFRALTTKLSTGVGAIYHHVANKNELLSAAANTVIENALAEATARSTPREAIRALSLGIFDAIDAHPWVGAQLSREPGQPAVLRIWQGIGAELSALGLEGSSRSDAGAALVNYVLGAASQYAAGPRLASEAERTAFLTTLAERWTLASPSVEAMALELREHDDRQQFLAGVDIFLAGISARE